MPFLLDYECSKGHRFEHMAANRESAPRWIACRVCYPVMREDVAAELHLYDEDDIPCIIAGEPAKRAFPVISGRAAPVTIVKGNGDFAERERDRLHKRAVAHNQTREVRDEIRMNTEHALSRAGVDVGLLRRGGW